MKLKLFLAPSLVIATLILLIWFVYPTYTHPSAVVDPANPASGVLNGEDDGLKERLATLAVERSKLETVDQRVANAKSLAAQIVANGDKKEALYTFIPESSKEEELIDMLNYNSGKEGLSIINISITPAKEEIASSTTAAAATLANSQAIAPVVAKDVEANLVVIGGYDQVKNLITRIYALKRFNKLTSLSITPATSTEGNQNGNMLQVNLSILFNTLKAPVSSINAENPVFMNSSFSMAVIENIQTKEGEILKLDFGTLGTSANPFLP